MRGEPREYEALELRAHTLLADVPLHDVWVADLPGGPGRTVLELRELLTLDKLARVSVPVRLLFALRGWLGRLLAWDREPSQPAKSRFIERLSLEERESSLVPPGTLEAPFTVLYVSPREALSELQNATVHAFSVFALMPRASGYRLYWAIYVLPVGSITSWYMRLINPFRRLIVYPAVLRYIRRAWTREFDARAEPEESAPKQPLD